MRILLWHVHGSWTTAFVQGRHEYLVPVLPGRGPDGRGRAQTYTWPASVREVTLQEARDSDVDVVVLQRPHELHHLAESWTGRGPGRDVPAVYVEHDAPHPHPVDSRHPCAERPEVLLVQVSRFNALMWDPGDAEVAVVEHGIVDPGERATGSLERAVAVVNEPVRRGRTVGADLLAEMGRSLPLDLLGLDTEALGGAGELRQDDLHAAMAARQVYLHCYRWTSLGLSLLEAMHLALPVVALGTTEVHRAVPPSAGVVSNDPEELADATRRLLADPEAARAMGKAARAHALERYGLARFLADWDRILEARA